MRVERYIEGGIVTGVMDEIPRWTLPDTSDLPGYSAPDALILNMVKANQILRDKNRELEQSIVNIEERCRKHRQEEISALQLSVHALQSKIRSLKKRKATKKTVIKKKKAKKRG